MSLAHLTQGPVYTVQPDEKIAKAARMMCEHCVGALVITDASGVTPLGVLTDRDIVWMIAEGLDPKVAEVGQFVHDSLHTVSITASLSEAMHAMREHGVRRLPIVDREARLVGILSMDDVLVLLGRELADAAATITGEMAQERRIGAAVRPRTP